MERVLMVVLDTNILIDVLRAAVATRPNRCRTGWNRFRACRSMTLSPMKACDCASSMA
jgi:hypothetical protein